MLLSQVAQTLVLQACSINAARRNHRWVHSS